jgi:hypothetical protein
MLNGFLLAGFGLALFATSAPAQDKKFDPKKIAGHWTLVSVDNVAADGTRTQGYGANPSGVAIFEPNHRFSVSLVDPALPKFASGNRSTGTADENKAVAVRSLFYFGTYMLSRDGTLSLEIEGSSFPNWIHVNQERKVTALTATQVKWTNPAASVGGTAELAWKRTK